MRNLNNRLILYDLCCVRITRSDYITACTNTYYVFCTINFTNKIILKDCTSSICLLIKYGRIVDTHILHLLFVIDVHVFV